MSHLISVKIYYNYYLVSIFNAIYGFFAIRNILVFLLPFSYSFSKQMTINY